MKKYYQIIQHLFFIFLLSNISISAQLLRHDDFQIKDSYWKWRSDGNQKQPIVENGLAHLVLQNAVDSFYCNTEFYDPTEPYTQGTQARVRLKCSNIHHGSRGWGFWDGESDLHSLALDYDVAWIMEQGSENPDSNYNWYLFGVNENAVTNRQTLDLRNIVDETEWHTYQIIWEKNKVSLFVDSEFIYETTKHIPNDNMRMDIWIDNRVLNISNPLEENRNIVDRSEILVDFVEISGLDGPSIKRSLDGDIILWDSPNTFPDGKRNDLWKQYTFDTKSAGEALIFLTGSAESYGNLLTQDRLKIVIDNTDFGWGMHQALDGNKLKGKGGSIVLPISLTQGTHSLDIYSDITPMLTDVIVVSAEENNVIYSEDFNETANNSDGLWHTIEFNTDNSSTVTVIISGTANENDGIRLEFDETDFGWQGEKSFDGNVLRGTPTTVVLNDFMEAGTHSLKIYSKGNPELYSIAAYGNSIVSEVAEETLLSKSISLKASPNPFNNSTNIVYSTNSASLNKVSIFNILGQRIKTLFNNYQSEGEYKLHWDATDETSGIYFVILESGNYLKVQKLLLLK